MDKNKLKMLVDYAVREGMEHTTDGRWSVSYNELYYHFGEKITDCVVGGCADKFYVLSEFPADNREVCYCSP